MKALLLAAGKGTRISRYLNGKPKCTVEIAPGLPLIQYTVDLLKSKGITDIAIVTGYKKNVIEDLLHDQGIKFYYSPFFDITNSIVSAWFARDFIKDDDIIIMNADVFCEEKLYDKIFETKQSPVMFYDTGRIEEADYKFYCENSKIVKYGKELTPDETSGEYVGIAKMDKEFLPTFVKQIETLVEQQQHSIWWENVLYSLTDKMPITACDIAPMFWAEVDYIEDYERIIEFVKQSGL